MLGRRAGVVLAVITSVLVLPAPATPARPAALERGKPTLVTIGDTTVPETDEAGQRASFAVKMTRGKGTKVTVGWKTVDGTATAGDDYAARSGTFVFKGPDTRQTRRIRVPVVGDDLVEPDETFKIRLTSITGGRFKRSTGTATVIDDDSPPPAHTLTVISAGASGVVTGPGINCGTECTEDLAEGTQVELDANPAPGYTFAGWYGACSGTGSCTLSMDADRTTGATFTIQKFTLTVMTSGSGVVTSSPGGISCPADCTESYVYNSQVTLSASPSPGWAFLGWGGACSGLGACTTTMDASRSVTATFGAG